MGRLAVVGRRGELGKEKIVSRRHHGRGTANADFSMPLCWRAGIAAAPSITARLASTYDTPSLATPLRTSTGLLNMSNAPAPGSWNRCLDAAA
jgi:hypothetical protein